MQDWYITRRAGIHGCSDCDAGANSVRNAAKRQRRLWRSLKTRAGRRKHRAHMQRQFVAKFNEFLKGAYPGGIDEYFGNPALRLFS